MKKTMMAVAFATVLSTAALAGDYDNTTINLTAVTDDYSISMKTPETGATEFAIGTEIATFDTSVKWKRDGDVDNYAVKAGKSMGLGLTPLYAGADAEFNFGDSFTSDTRTINVSPYIGITSTIEKLTPFVEFGYAWQSTTNDVVDFDRNSSYIKLGSSYALTEQLSAKVSIKESRDIDFGNPGDRNAEVGLTVNF